MVNKVDKKNISKKSNSKKNTNKKSTDKKSTSKKSTSKKSDSKKSDSKGSIDKNKQPDIKITWKDEKSESRNIYENLEYKMEPIKVIYKYKNNNEKNQYLMYIFVGVIGKRYESIFKKIENLNLYDTLITLTLAEEKKLINMYGDLWITKFFNIYHISLFVNKLESKPELKKELLKKYDNIWLSNFINKFKQEVIFKKVNYSYSDLINLQYKIKMGKKLEKVILEKEDIDDVSFLTKKTKVNQSVKNILYIKDLQIGGSKIENGTEENGKIEGDLFENIIDDDNKFKSINDEYDENDDIDDLDIIEDFNEEIEIEEEDMEKLYQIDDIDKNLNSTKVMLSSILEDTKILEKKNNYMIKFDDSRENDIDNQYLENVYEKKFIYSQYIYKDDSIKCIKNKICCSIKNNAKYGKDAFLIPSRIYLWSEYLINSKLEKIMIGQKWMKKNELLEIDAEPLPLKNYENLEGPIKNFKDVLKRYAGKIKREDEDNNILYDYENFMMNDTIFMIDIYNELGEKYSSNTDKLNNLIDTYFKIYFPKIKVEDITGIIDFLNKQDVKTEETKIKGAFDTIYNDLIIEKEIMDLIEITKIEKRDEYLKLFSDGNFITQSVIHVHLEIYDEQIENDKISNKNSGEYGIIALPKLDLHRIYNDFDADSRYPFIQYQVPDGQIIFKYYEEYMYEFSKTKDNIDMISKWFENSPYGISFKVKLSNEKFMAININEIGKIEYKTQWKEEDMANINDIINTYEYVRELVIKINNTIINHPRKISIKIPEPWEFRFAFINCIQKFKLPDNKMIDHNDLSDFCRFFYPYVSLVIEPKKRVSKDMVVDQKSKYGSYLRYKRVSKYDNQAKIEQRIVAYMRNFNFEDDVLIEEISKQFNITIEKAKDEVVKVKGKFPNITTTKIAKRLDMPKFKSPGIGIDIQGRNPEKYTIRISGAREQKQLERIIILMNILIYLYADTYILKNPERQEIKEKLRKLTNVAKRRNKVDDVINYQKEVKTVKQMTKIDQKRIGFTPNEGHNQWTRQCQNSGEDKKRRPFQTTSQNTSELIAKGYK
jgi:hypothetical protein